MTISAGGNSHQANMMNVNAIGPSSSPNMAAIHGGSGPIPGPGGLRSTDSAGSGMLTDSMMTDSEHRKSKQDDDTNPRKEKSVLQAKLTKLAIQIGYAGMPYNSLACLKPITRIYLFYPFEKNFRFRDCSNDRSDSHFTLCVQQICIW